jgi:hypothetical protein
MSAILAELILAVKPLCVVRANIFVSRTVTIDVHFIAEWELYFPGLVIDTRLFMIGIASPESRYGWPPIIVKVFTVFTESHWY